ncbi:uncharacterized protein LOC111368267 [Olea europaea var. sylvestris]|uniref:uncharacterized protein LOC111368267 n=1 Tax=Olea europaea var. sylvestris TaxID=158386 RepID=UPI000C1CFEC8|nr:uncharacterized protein LOC111368267 [Olea europaea var. sylvestris]
MNVDNFDEGISNNVEFDIAQLPTDPEQVLESKVESKQARSVYVIRLNASIDHVRILLQQGHTFWGHDESEDSLNPVSACVVEMINVVIKDIGDSPFSILVDESRDVSIKEQMPIVLCYADNIGHVNERFIGIEHVTSTTALSLKTAIDKVFSRYNLSMSKLRGQGYDGANVLAMIVEVESCSSDQRSNATNLSESVQTFDFKFNLQLMRSVLGMSNELLKALQMIDQDIVNAMQLMRLCKR